MRNARVWVLRHMLKRFAALCGACALVASPVAAKERESWYQNEWCQTSKHDDGRDTEYKQEHHLFGGQMRVDCVIFEDGRIYASGEFDFGKKWAECLGQSIAYGQATNSIPFCALIRTEENNHKFPRFVQNIRIAIEGTDPKVVLQCISPTGEGEDCPEEFTPEVD